MRNFPHYCNTKNMSMFPFLTQQGISAAQAARAALVKTNYMYSKPKNASKNFYTQTSFSKKELNHKTHVVSVLIINPVVQKCEHAAICGLEP